MANTEVLKLYAWKPGQSGNPKGRPRGSKLRSRLKRREKAAFAALDRALASENDAVALAAFKLWSELCIEAGVGLEIEADSQRAKLKERLRNMPTSELIAIAKRKQLPELSSGEKQAQRAERPESSDGNPNSNE